VKLVSPLALLVLLLSPLTHASEPQLYPTGPSEDSSYLRFVNTLAGNLEIKQGKSIRVDLTAKNGGTAWQAVKANSPLPATLSFGGRVQEVVAQVKPSQFVTYAAVQDPKDGWRMVEVIDKSPDFSSLKAALALVNLMPDCPAASARLSGKNVVIVDQVGYAGVVRRMVNPVSLTVDVLCGEHQVGESVNLNLRPGERWSLIAYPAERGTGVTTLLDKLP